MKPFCHFSIWNAKLQCHIQRLLNLPKADLIPLSSSVPPNPCLTLCVNKYNIAVIEHLPCATGCVKYFTWIIAFNPYRSQMTSVQLPTSPFYRKRNWQYSHLPWLSEAESGFELQAFASRTWTLKYVSYVRVTSPYVFTHQTLMTNDSWGWGFVWFINIPSTEQALA